MLSAFYSQLTALLVKFSLNYVICLLIDGYFAVLYVLVVNTSSVYAKLLWLFSHVNYVVEIYIT